MAQKSEKLTKQELQAPDAFQKAGSEASTRVAERQKTLLIGAGVLLVGLLGVLLAQRLSERGEEQSAAALSDSLKTLQRPISSEVPAGFEAPADQQPFATQQEKDEAVVKELTAFRQEHSGTRAAVTAAFNLGMAQLRLGQHKEAIASFGAFLEKTPSGDPLRATAIEGQGYAYEATKQYDQALAAFETLSKEAPPEFLVGMGDYHRARILALQDKKDEAARILVGIPPAHPGSAAARLAQERLALLAAAGVKLPEAPAPVPAPAVKVEGK